jgi:hypothetical protein
VADPQEGGKLRDTKHKSILRRPSMLSTAGHKFEPGFVAFIRLHTACQAGMHMRLAVLRSQTVNTIHDLNTQGKSVIKV